MSKLDGMLKYLRIPMAYEPGVNNNQTGKGRRTFLVLIVTRFGLTCPTIVGWLFGINKRQALELLNKLTKEGLLYCVQTIRSVDGRVYVPTYTCVKFAEEMIGVEVYYRSQSNPSLLINHNNIQHDLILSFLMLKLLGQPHYEETYKAAVGILSELEFKRLFKSHDIRNVDGIIETVDGELVAIDFEHSFKNVKSRQQILIKYAKALREGYYSKVFLCSQSPDILSDAKRINNLLINDMQHQFDKKTKQPLLSPEDAVILNDAIIYRTKFCDSIYELFYK